MPEIQMPKLSDTMTEGTVVSWKKKVGDEVTAGEVLAEIETDKATMEWEATDDGVLQEIYVPEGGKVNVGDRIAFIGGEGEKAPNEKKETEKPTPAKTQEPETAPSEEKAPAKKAPEKKE
ncbi:MAG TPA: biotin/lipoyl-containing protein, partial [Chthoniobacterales bacterium]